MYSLSVILLIHQFDLKKIREKTLYRPLEFVLILKNFRQILNRKIFL